MTIRTRQITPLILSAILFSLLLCGCGSVTATEVAATSTPVVPTVETTATIDDGARTMPLTAIWVATENSIISTDEFSLAVYGLLINGSGVTAVYTLSGISSDELLDQYRVEVFDNALNPSRLMEITPIGQIESLEFGEMVFGPGYHSNKLFLRVANEKIDESVQIAELIGGTEPPNYDTTLVTTPLEPIGQGGMQIKFEGWQMIPEALSAEDAAKPMPETGRSDPLLPVPDGVYLFTEASLTIDRADTNSRDYVGLQLLSDHSIIESINGNLTKSIFQPEELIEAYPGP